MSAKFHIPAIALLGLQLTECKADEQDPLVGEWFAVEVDGQKFPLVVSEDGSEFRQGYELSVEPDLAGRFGLYYAGEYEDIGYRGEYSFPIDVDDAEAPRYRIELRLPLSEVDPVGEDYADGGEPLAPGPGLEMLGVRPHPSAAEQLLQLDCTLADEFLTCKQSGLDDFPNDMRLARKPEEL